MELFEILLCRFASEYDVIWKLFVPILTAFAVSAVMGRVLIPWLTRLKFGQQILEEGPSWHKKKAGTPTMGGIMFIIGVAVACAIMLTVNFSMKLLMMFLVSLGFGAIGYLDDYIKVVKKQNLGLRAWQKFFLQLLLAGAFIGVMLYIGEIDSEIIIPFAAKTLAMPMLLFVPFCLFVVTGTVNAVNLTDGLDGLAATVTVVVSLFFALVGFIMGDSAATVFALAVAGGCMGFLIYNRHPAKVFMGDTGSLFLGGAICMLAIGMQLPLILIIAGFVYLFEALSVIIQVASFKLTGKRVFLMSPIHHHFEKKGWSEFKIVTVFSLVTVVLCAVALFSLIGCF